MRLLFNVPPVAFLGAAGAVAQLLNVTIDDTSSMIDYVGGWEPSSTHLSGLDYGGSHTLSTETNATATLVFTGVAVYYLSPLWPYAVSSGLSIDGSAPELVNLTDPNASPTPPGGPESASYSVMWSATNLENITHTVVVSYGDYVIVDGFIYTEYIPCSYTQYIPAPTSSSAAPSISFSSNSPFHTTSASHTSSATHAASSNGAPSNNASVRRSNSKALPIGLGTALGVLASLLATSIVFVLRYRRRKQRAHDTSQPKMTDNWNKPQGITGRDAAVPSGRMCAPDVSEARPIIPFPTVYSPRGREASGDTALRSTRRPTMELIQMSAPCRLEPAVTSGITFSNGWYNLGGALQSGNIPD